MEKEGFSSWTYYTSAWPQVNFIVLLTKANRFLMNITCALLPLYSFKIELSSYKGSTMKILPTRKDSLYMAARIVMSNRSLCEGVKRSIIMSSSNNVH